MNLCVAFLIALIPLVFVSSTEALPPPWVQKLIESKSGVKFPEVETTTEAPVIVYSAAVFPQQKKGPGSTYPYWKWKEAYAGKWVGKGGKKSKGKGRGGKWEQKWEEKAM